MAMSLRVSPVVFAFLLMVTSFSASAFSGILGAFHLGGKQLVLNGAGTRTKFIISVYNAGLYLQKKSNNAKQIMSANEPMAIRMKVVSGFASAAKMKQALNQGFHNSTGGKISHIKPQIDQLLKVAFSGKVNKGDVYDLAYIPNIGTQVIKNKKGLTTIKGLPFKQALFGIWLSAKPAQLSLKNQMLGKN